MWRTGSRTAKRLSSSLPRGGAKAKARARHDDLAALAAVQRLREAKDNPLLAFLSAHAGFSCPPLACTWTCLLLGC